MAVFKVVSVPFYDSIERINCVKKTAFAIQLEEALQGFVADKKLYTLRYNFKEFKSIFPRTLRNAFLFQIFFLLMFINERQNVCLREKWALHISSPAHIVYIYEY